MREIKFRGHYRFDHEDGRVSERWVYGYYFKHPETDTHSIFLMNGKGSRVVDKSSVGQYIGLQDKNGVEIYEHDIVVAKHRNKEIIITGSIQAPKSCWVLQLKTNDNKLRWYRTAEFSELEVIGNIHENPELL